MKNKTFRRQFTAILAVYTVLTLALWFLYHNTAFGAVGQNTRENLALAEQNLLSKLDDEFSRARLVTSMLAGSVYVQDFLEEKNVTAYYEKAGAVSEIIRKTTYPNMNADSILTLTAGGALYRFTGGVSSRAVETLYRDIANGGTALYSVAELDGTAYFCLSSPVRPRGLGESAPIGHVVTLSNIEKVRRTLMELTTGRGIETAVILNNTILFSSDPELDGQSASELDRRFGSVTVSGVTGSDLSVAAAITKDALYLGERLFGIISVVMLALMLAAVALLYRVLSKRMILPMLEQAGHMRMGLLKTQINTHFVVNTVTCIESLSRQGENEKAAAAAENLAGMLKALHQSGDEINTFEMLENLNRYIEIMNIRNGNKFIVDLDVDDRLSEYRVPEQVIQPLVENALTHGVGNKKSDCRVTVTGRAEKDCVLFEVSDNGAGMEPAALHDLRELLGAADEWDFTEYGLSGVALLNIQKRIRTQYGVPYGLTLSAGAEAGITAAVRLPLIEDR